MRLGQEGANRFHSVDLELTMTVQLDCIKTENSIEKYSRLRD